MANDGLCPLQYQTYQSNGTCLYSPRTPGYGTACTIPPPLPIPSYGRPGGGPVIVAVPCCMPGQLPATTSYSPSPNDPPYLLYTGRVLPRLGQVPQPERQLSAGAVVHQHVSGGRSTLMRQTNSCCPPGNSSHQQIRLLSAQPVAAGRQAAAVARRPRCSSPTASCLPRCNANSIPSTRSATPAPTALTHRSEPRQGVCCLPRAKRPPMAFVVLRDGTRR